MAYKITAQTRDFGGHKDTHSFTVKYKWVCNVCVWLLLKRGYPAVETQDLNLSDKLKKAEK